MPLNNNNENEKSVYVNDPDLYNREIRAVPAPERGVGIDTKETIFDNIVQAGQSSQIDLNSLDSFTTISQGRDQIYSMLDTMCQDPTISAVLETYAEDSTEYNDHGQVVWCESSDANIQKYVTYLLDTMNVDKNVYKWVHSLCKYGDVYFRLYRESDLGEDDLFNVSTRRGRKRSKSLNEDVKVKVYSQNDHYVNYIEMVPNPAEVFELTKLGKTYAYIKAPLAQVNKSMSSPNSINNSFFQYSFKKNDVELHGPMDFVHASLEDNSSRTPEKIQIFTNDKEDGEALTYTVKRGQSLLYNTFKVWRELSLLENSVLLNRVTKSSVVRVIGVEVGDMPKEMVGPHLQGVKQLIEQKSAINSGNSMTEYTNPGPIENNIYVPTHEGIGAISTSQIGGEVDVKSLADLSYYQDKLFGNLRVPKQYFGVTDDGAGFNGGSSLTIISSRYGKMIKRIQNTMVQAITDVINLLLLDRGLNGYVNNFTIKMLAPTTQEELDRRENLSSKVALTSDVMNMLGDIQDTETKLKILKSLLSNVITNGEVIDLIQGEIDKLEAQREAEEASELESESESTSETEVETEASVEEAPSTSESTEDEGMLDFSLESIPTEGEESMDTSSESTDTMSTSDTSGGEETILPSPEELGVDLTVND